MVRVIVVERGTAARRPRRVAPPVRMPTERELEVLRAYLETARYDLAAEQLQCSTGYVADVLASVREKTGSANTSQAVYRLRYELGRSRRRQQTPRENKG